MKICNRCDQEKALDCFSRHPHGRDGYNTQCKKCKAELTRIRRAINPAEHLERARQWKLNNPEKVESGKVAYRLANPEKVKAARKISYQKFKAKELANATAYKLANKPKMREIAMRRVARKIQATPAWANKAKIEEIYLAADLIGKLSGIKYHVDHAVPLVSKFVCGLHCESNLQILTASANQSKSNHYWPDMPTSIGVHQ